MVLPEGEIAASAEAALGANAHEPQRAAGAARVVSGAEGMQNVSSAEDAQNVSGARAGQKPWALITGATGGLGQEFVRQVAAEGEYNLALVGRSQDKLAALVAEVGGKNPNSIASGRESRGVQTMCFTADLSQAGAVGALVAEIKRAGIVPELLINNAGFGYDAAFAESDLARQQALVQTNCEALMELCHAFAPAMVARGHGSILNVASVAGFLPGPYMATYYASKAFVQSLTAALHVELAPRGVHVTALCPGPVKTAFWDNADAGHTALAHMCTSAPRVVRAGLRALGRNATYCAPGIMAKFIVLCGRLLPRTSSHVVVALQKPEG